LIPRCVYHVAATPTNVTYPSTDWPTQIGPVKIALFRVAAPLYPLIFPHFFLSFAPFASRLSQLSHSQRFLGVHTADEAAHHGSGDMRDGTRNDTRARVVYVRRVSASRHVTGAQECLFFLANWFIVGSLVRPKRFIAVSPPPR